MRSVLIIISLQSSFLSFFFEFFFFLNLKAPGSTIEKELTASPPQEFSHIRFFGSFLKFQVNGI